MLHLLYVIAFTILAFLAISNLIRNLVTLSADSQRRSHPGRSQFRKASSPSGFPPHPELLDATGKMVNEPLLVMKSITVEDAREQLDALYKASPGYSEGTHEE